MRRHPAVGVLVRVHGKLGAADHVYAHDRVLALRRLAPDRAFGSTVTINAGDGDGGRVAASAVVHLDGAVVRARSVGKGLRPAVDALHDRLRDRIGTLTQGQERGATG